MREEKCVLYEKKIFQLKRKVHILLENLWVSSKVSNLDLNLIFTVFSLNGCQISLQSSAPSEIYVPGEINAFLSLNVFVNPWETMSPRVIYL